MELKEYEVEIAETLVRNVPVKAKNPADAVATVKSLYLNEVIVLDSGDYLMTEYYFNGDKVC